MSAPREVTVESLLEQAKALGYAKGLLEAAVAAKDLGAVLLKKSEEAVANMNCRGM
jgi:hypothetical protein